MRLILPKLLLVLSLVLVYLFAVTPKTAQAVINDFCYTKRACWSDTCETIPADQSNYYYGGFCDNGTFNPWCERGTDWKFWYPSCDQINFNCRKEQWENGECGQQGTTTCTWQQQNCPTSDSCTAPQPYLNPGLCQPSNWDNIPANAGQACQISPTIYKTCCNSDGTVDGNCNGGNYTGTCPAGTTTVICGVSSCAGIGGNCTTAACGPSACQATCTRTPGSYAGSICTCNWLTIERYRCDGSTYLAEGQSDSSCNTPEFCPTTDYCNTDIVCGACTLTSSGNACSGNGTQTCTYTGSTTNNLECNPVDAPPQTCSINNCSPGYSCAGGICNSDGGGGPTCNFDSSKNQCCADGYSQFVNTGTWSDGSGDCWDTGPCDQVNAACRGGGCNNNGIQDNGETGIDCGGGSCPSCGGGSKYSCSGNSCVLDPNGNYTSLTDCNSSCGPCPSGICEPPPPGLCPVMHPFAQIRNLTKGENFPSSVSYKGVTYNLSSPGACMNSGPSCGLAIESAAQSINADPGDVLEMRVMELNENARSGAIHSVDVRFWGDKGITAYPNGFADDEAGKGNFCTNQYFNGLTSFANAKIYCVGGGSMGCPWTYSAGIEDKKSEPGEPQAWGTGVVSTNWNTARYQVAADAVAGTTAGITAVTWPVSGIQTPSGQCFWQNNGSASDKDFRWKTDDPMCPFTNDMFYDSLPLTVQINGCRGYNTIDAPAEGTSYTLNNTYTFSGWSTFCFGPNGTNRNRVEPYICDQGTWNNCRYIGPTSSSVRQDVVNLGWTCGNLNPNSDGWTFNFTPDSTDLGNKTLRVASINDNNNPPNCLVWEAKNINIAVSTVPISGYIRSFQGEGIRGVEVEVTDNTLGVTRSSRPSEASGFWQVDGLVRTGDSYAVRIPGGAPEGYILPPRTSTCDYSWNFDVNDQLPAVRPNPWADTPCWYSSSYEGQKAGSRDCAGADGAGVTGRCNFVYDRDLGVEPTPPPPIPTPNTNPWIQTTTGDVHSNTNINTPGGP